MKFVVFHKTGELRDKQGDWDGDEGYQENFEISNGEVESHIKHIIVSEYFDFEQDSTNFDKAYQMLTELFDSVDIFDDLVKLFQQELQDWAQQLYDNK